MKKFLQLTSLELQRAKWLYCSLIIVAMLLQIGSFIFGIYDHISRYDTMSLQNEYSITALDNMITVLVVGGVLLAVIIYCFYTWWREWRSNGQFIYRLLMLPGSKRTIYFAKLCSVFVMIMGILAAQVLVVFIAEQVGELWLQEKYIMGSTNVIELIKTDLYILSVFFPTNWFDILFFFSSVIMFIGILFQISILALSAHGSGWLKKIVSVVGYMIGVFALIVLIIRLLIESELMLNEKMYIALAIIWVFNGLQAFWSSWIVQYRLGV